MDGSNGRVLPIGSDYCNVYEHLVSIEYVVHVPDFSLFCQQSSPASTSQSRMELKLSLQNCIAAGHNSQWRSLWTHCVPLGTKSPSQKP